MVLGKDENVFCVADAQATIERLVAEPKITAYRAMKVIEVQHYTSVRDNRVSYPI